MQTKLFGPYNCGDELSEVVVQWMLSKKSLSTQTKTKTKTTKLLVAIGSHLFWFYDDATIWGGGANMNFPRHSIITRYLHFPLFQHLDFRCVRGPLTREMALSLKHECPKIYGDPAILMPLIYQPKISDVKNKILIIPHNSHFKKISAQYGEGEEYHILTMNTKDYQSVIDTIASSKLVISSSLHGVILAEIYGVPCVHFRFDKKQDFKFLDWYYSTGRRDVTLWDSVEEALSATPPPLPTNIEQLQQDIMSVLPYDLWDDRLE